MSMMNPSPKSFCIVYGVTFSLSLFIVVPMGINLGDFKGQCILSATGDWKHTNGSREELNVEWHSASNCNFIMFMGIASLSASIFLLWRSTLFVFKGHDGSPFYSFVSMIGGFVTTFCLFCCSFITSIGYSHWCSILTADPNAGDNPVCWNINLTDFAKKYDVSPDNFSSNIEIVEFGAWSSSLAWLAATILSFFKVRYYHKNEELLQGLAFEKGNLIPHRSSYRRIGEESGTLS